MSLDELVGVAASIRRLHNDPVSDEATKLRRVAADFFLDTEQVRIERCGSVLELLPKDESVSAYLTEFLLSMGAAVIEVGARHPDPVEINLRTLDGLLVFYQARLKLGASERQSSLDDLLAKSKNRTAFRQLIGDKLRGCGAQDLGLDP